MVILEFVLSEDIQNMLIARKRVGRESGITIDFVTKGIKDSKKIQRRISFFLCKTEKLIRKKGYNFEKK